MQDEVDIVNNVNVISIFSMGKKSENQSYRIDTAL